MIAEDGSRSAPSTRGSWSSTPELGPGPAERGAPIATSARAEVITPTAWPSTARRAGGPRRHRRAAPGIAAVGRDPGRGHRSPASGVVEGPDLAAPPPAPSRTSRSARRRRG
jgi:hypothetical protein